MCGKVKELFMELKEKQMQNLPVGTQNDKNAPWNEPYYGTKKCPECNGEGSVAESKCCGGSIIEGICTICDNPTEPVKCNECLGYGVILRTEEDDINDREDSVSQNDEIRKDV
jgi:DnaJ-class molecular chaperone